MPRNIEENIYITIGFYRRSPTWIRLQREAGDLDISVAHFIKLLLADRVAALEGHGRDLWFPRDIRVNQDSAAASSPTNMPPSAAEDDASRRATAAAAAANYWERLTSLWTSLLVVIPTYVPIVLVYRVGHTHHHRVTHAAAG